jgi:glutamate/tyrosine decarboxylase-like PLP-dependent enzyme
MIRHHIALGQWFADQVAGDDRFEVVFPPRFGLTCFRLKGADNAKNKQLMEAVNAQGGCGMSCLLCAFTLYQAVESS